MSNRMRLLVGAAIVAAVASQALPAQAGGRGCGLTVTFSDPLHHPAPPSTFGPFDSVQIKDGLPNHFRLSVFGIVGTSETYFGAVHQTGSTSPQGLGDLEWVADSNYWATLTIADSCAAPPEGDTK